MNTLNKLRTPDETLLTCICNDMATGGRKAFMQQHKEYFLTHSDEKIRVVAKEGQTDDEAVENCTKFRLITKSHPTEKDKNIELFEGFHLKKFAEVQAPKEGNSKESPHQLLLDKLAQSRSKNILTDITNKTNVSHAAVRNVFEQIAVLKDISLAECLRNFLIYCKKGYLPLRAFNTTDNLVPQDRIDDLEKLIARGQAAERCSETKYSEQSARQESERYTTVKSDDNWLSPRNETFIPFVGREEELQALDAFSKDDPDNESNFKLWAIVGPSGAGKTRLLIHWANREILNDWKAIDVNSSTRINWSEWAPKCQTLISIDYIYGYDEVISDILARAGNTTFAHPVRLLLLDHATPDSMAALLKDPRWGLERRRPEDFTLLQERFFFKNSPLILQAPKDEDHDYDEFLAKIMCTVAFKGEENPSEKIADPVIERGLAYLRETTGARQPLFAALVGDAIKNGMDNGDTTEAYRTLNRRALIEHYLQGKTRLTWLMEKSNRGMWAACFVAAATAQRGVKFKTLRQVLPKKQRYVIDRDYKKFKSLCNSVVSGSDVNELTAFEPAILGETHFLLLLQEIGANFPVFETFLPTLITAEESRNEGAEEFVAFMNRLAQNLSNDDSKNENTQTYWQLIIQLLTQKNVWKDHSFKWATSMACFEICLILITKEQYQLAEKFLNRVQANDLYRPPMEQIKPGYIVLAIEYFGLTENEENQIPPLLNELLEFWDSDLNREYTALMLAIRAVNAIVSNSLVEKCSNIHFAGICGATALMFACVYDKEAVALKLVEKNANLEAQDDQRRTALMFACRHGQEAVALKLVEKNANLEAQNDERWTALMFACRHGLEAVALKLVEKNANIHSIGICDSTALMIACRYDQEAVALKLVEMDANLEVQNDECWTALMFACRYGLEAVALKLVEMDANLEVQNDECWTALMFACRYGQEAVALKLVEKNANLEVQDKNGCTALMFACLFGQEVVALKLVEKIINVNYKSKTGLTNLMIAVYSNQKQVVSALLEKKVETDDVCKSGANEFTALGLARQLESHEIVEMLESADAREIPPYEPASCVVAS